jgi:hypothetical protein
VRHVGFLGVLRCQELCAAVEEEVVSTEKQLQPPLARFQQHLTQRSNTRAAERFSPIWAPLQAE